MENTELTIIENTKVFDFDATSKEFVDFIKNEFTHTVTGQFYEQSACEMLSNVQNVIAQNPNSITVLSNEQLMIVVGKFLGRQDFLNEKGDFNPKCIFAFAKEEHGVDLLGAIPAMFRPAVMSAIGL